MIEPEVRYQIDCSLNAKGWILNPGDILQNVFFENAVKKRLSAQSCIRLGQKKPDYTLFDDALPMAVIEAKKSDVVNLDEALNQASDYADRIGVSIVFACNAFSVKSRHLKNSEPLYFNNVELNELPSLNLLRKYHIDDTNHVFTISPKVIKSRGELISLFSELNNDFRSIGIQAGTVKCHRLFRPQFCKVKRRFFSEIRQVSDTLKLNVGVSGDTPV